MKRWSNNRVKLMNILVNTAITLNLQLSTGMTKDNKNNFYYITLKKLTNTLIYNFLPLGGNFIDNFLYTIDEGYHYEKYKRYAEKDLNEFGESIKDELKEINKKEKVLWADNFLSENQLNYINLIGKRLIDLSEEFKELYRNDKLPDKLTDNYNPISLGLDIKNYKANDLIEYISNENSLEAFGLVIGEFWYPELLLNEKIPIGVLLSLSENKPNIMDLTDIKPVGSEFIFDKKLSRNSFLGTHFKEDDRNYIHNKGLGSICKCCKNGRITVSGKNYMCTNKSCLWGVLRHSGNSKSFTGGYIFPCDNIYNLVNYCHPMRDIDFGMLLEKNVGRKIKLYVLKNPFNELVECYTDFPDMSKAFVSEFKIVQKTSSRVMLEPLNNTSNFSKFIVITSYSNFIKSADALFKDSHRNYKSVLSFNK